jgi:hypothetical protein
MNTGQHRYDDITSKIIGCAYQVSNTLGCGFLEKVYENSLAHDLRKAGLAVKRLEDIHTAQCINYLRATEKPLCLLMNFATPRVQIKRLASPDFIRVNQCSSVVK